MTVQEKSLPAATLALYQSCGRRPNPLQKANGPFLSFLQWRLRGRLQRCHVGHSVAVVSYQTRERAKLAGIRRGSGFFESLPCWLDDTPYCQSCVSGRRLRKQHFSRFSFLPLFQSTCGTWRSLSPPSSSFPPVRRQGKLEPLEMSRSEASILLRKMKETEAMPNRRRS